MTSVARSLTIYGATVRTTWLGARPTWSITSSIGRPKIAGKHAATSDVPSRAGMLLSKAIALAAVEVLEGKPRPLARKRRRPLRQSPYRV
jgi:hypothetical protein